MRYVVTVDGQTLEIDCSPDGRFTVEGTAVAAEIRPQGGRGVRAVHLDGRVHEVAVLGYDPLRLQIDGREVRVTVADARALVAARTSGAASSGRTDLKAPMPGLVKAVHVAEGDIVEAGAAVVTLEAMKMENELRAPGRGQVARVRAAAGDRVERDALLVVIEPA